jgi:hypothetical protein
LVKWLLLVYKISPDPSARRVYIWRKLKRLGAVILHDSVWVLPANLRTREQFQWLAAEIIEMGGEALLWEGQLVLAGQEEPLKQQFIAQVDRAYAEILADLPNPEADLAALARKYQQARLEDYFESEMGRTVRNALLAAGGRVEQ